MCRIRQSSGCEEKNASQKQAMIWNSYTLLHYNAKLEMFLGKSNLCRDDDDDDDDDDGLLIHFAYKDCLSPWWDVEVIEEIELFQHMTIKNYITIHFQ